MVERDARLTMLRNSGARPRKRIGASLARLRDDAGGHRASAFCGTGNRRSRQCKFDAGKYPAAGSAVGGSVAVAEMALKILFHCGRETLLFCHVAASQRLT